MAISFLRPDPSSPTAVAEAAFGTARRGFDQQEVRDFLRMVSAELSRLQERERFLERELRAAQAGPSGVAPELDEETVTRLLGEETSRILQTARESGLQIKARAEEAAGRLLRDATDEAQRQREAADVEAARRRSDAAADAEAELGMAKQQGREMVEEARAYRERVLGELARRREQARQQIDQLVHGRDRLLQVFERARLVAVDVVADLTPLGGSELDIDLLPTTGPVPIIVPGAALADASAVDDAVLAGSAAMFDQEREVPAPESAESAESDVVDDGEHPGADVVMFPAAGPVVVPAPTGGLEEIEEIEEIDDDDVTATDVDDLFARLRADQPADAAGVEVDTDGAPSVVGDAAAPADAAEGAVETPFQQRDAALVPLIVAAARKLKRVLADEQNEVLDTLRRKEPVRTLDVLVPWASEHGDRYADAVSGELFRAVGAGAASIAADAELDGSAAGPIGPARESVATGLVEPLRERLARAVEHGDGENEAITKRVRAVYREFKTQRIDEQLDDVFRMAHGRGVLEAFDAGAQIVWSRDPAHAACPDCEDNSLSGPVTVGDAFPTGHTCAPAHAGCRCLLQRADS